MRRALHTIGTNFVIFEMALGPLSPFAVLHKYTEKLARHQRTNPKDNTPLSP